MRPTFQFLFILLVDKEFIEERRRSLKRYLQIICRHPTICETEIIKFFLTFQGTVRIFYTHK
jgi:sorting nexin-8